MSEKPPQDEALRQGPQFGHFDALIIGTGLSECALSGALALAGKKVLHVDQSRRYGSAQADFRLKEFIDFLKTETPNQNKQAIMRDFVYSDLSIFEEMSPKELSSYSRKFIIELMPLVLFSKSYGVDFLISSGCSLYLQFNTVCNNYFSKDDRTYRIPYSKSEIFQSGDLTLKEKRELSRIISNCMHFATDPALKDINSTHTYEKETQVSNEEQALFQTYRNKPVSQYFQKLGVDSKVLDLLLYAIAFVNESQTQTTTQDFFQRTAKYLRSIGYYGNSPMIMSQFGSSEYLQAFSRLSAVFGGIFAINQDLQIQNLKYSEDGTKAKSVEMLGLQEEAITADQFFISREYQYLLPRKHQSLSAQEGLLLGHMILLTRVPLISDLSSVGLLVIAPNHPKVQNTHPIRVLQQGAFSNNTPDGEYLLHCTMIKEASEQNNWEVFEKLKGCILEEFGTESEKNEEKKEEVKNESEKAVGPEEVEKEEESGLAEEEAKKEGQTNQLEEEKKQEEKKEAIFFFCMYNQHMLKPVSSEAQECLPKNVHLISGSDFELDLDTDLIRAEEIYYKVEGEETEHLFLQRKKEQQQEEVFESEIPSEEQTIDDLLGELGDI